MVAAGLGLRGLDTHGLEAGRVKWLRLDVDFTRHPKVARLSDRAFRFHVAAMLHAAEYLTDGRLTRQSAITVGSSLEYRGVTKLVTELCEAGLWELSPDANAGFLIHGFTEKQPTKADVERDREAARERMRRFRSPERSPERNAVTQRRTSATTVRNSSIERPRPTGPSPARTNGQGNLTTTVATTQQLEALVRNGGYAYTDTSLADELRAKGADDVQVSEMLELAGTLRTAAT